MFAAEALRNGYGRRCHLMAHTFLRAGIALASVCPIAEAAQERSNRCNRAEPNIPQSGGAPYALRGVTGSPPLR